MRTANLALKFALELAVVAALGYWGASLPGGVLSAVVMVLAPAVMILLWGRFAAPNATGRLPRSQRIPFELTVLLLGALALGAAGRAVLAVVLAVVIVLNTVLLGAFGQLEA